MKLQTKILIPILAVLILSFAFIIFIKINYANNAADNVMELMDAEHIMQAQVLAYMIANDPGLLEYDDNGFNYKLADLAVLFGVDEIHVTDENGVLRWGNIQDYYGFDFRDGEQSRELLSILTNPESIAQEPRPRGIDNVMFQYISVPRTDRTGIVQIGVSMEHVMEIKDAMDHRGIFILIGILTLGVVALIIIFLTSAILKRPLKKLTDGVSRLELGNLDVSIDVIAKDELGLLAETFNKMTTRLKDSIEQNARERAEKERIGAELDVATKIQTGMLPCIFPAFPDRAEFDLYASMEPAKEVGGDFYDLFMIDNNTLAVVMADVSGKGVPAALFMVIAKTLIKNNTQSGKTPKEVFEAVNNLLCENNEAGMFVTAILGVLDIPSGKFTFVNAGHNPPLLRSGKCFDWLKVKPGFVLAGMEDMLYKQHEILLKPGDELFLYTDGITEAVNNENALFGDPRLLETVNANLDLPLKEFTVSIKREVDKFAQGAEQADDITMLVLRFIGEKTN